jgi:purine-binding chemotaxis protein CheW
VESQRDPGGNVDEILAERAAALARPVEADTLVDTMSLLFLVLGEERYGVDVSAVLGVEAMPELTPIPGAPPPWIGVVNIRGTLVPVLDTHSYMGQRTDDSTSEEARVVLVSDSQMTVGLLVDDVADVGNVPIDEIRPALGGGPPARADVVKGVTPDMAAIVDVEKLLSEASLALDQGPESQGGTRG